MTCIIGFRFGDTAYLAADRRVINHNSLRLARESNKVLSITPPGTSHPFKIATTGNARWSEMLKYIKLPPFEGESFLEKSFLEWLGAKFAPAIFKAATDKSSIWYDKEAESHSINATWVIAYQGRLYQIFSDFLPANIEGDVLTAGSGGDAARGAIHVCFKLATMKQLEEPDTLVPWMCEHAFAAAATINAGCGATFNLESSVDPKYGNPT